MLREKGLIIYLLLWTCGSKIRSLNFGRGETEDGKESNYPETLSKLHMPARTTAAGENPGYNKPYPLLTGMGKHLQVPEN